MKQIPPSTLRAHLAQNQAADPRSDSPHPDADLLTAFAEDTLIDRERTGVLAHLAACPECRAIVHTAAVAETDRESETVLESVPPRRPLLEQLPAAMPASSLSPAPPSEPVPARSPLRTWFSGVALAASLLVMVASTVLFYRAFHVKISTQNASIIAAPQPPPPAQQITAATSAARAVAPTAAPKHSHAPAHPTTPATPPALQTEEARAAAIAPAPAAGVSSSTSLGDFSAERAQSVPPAEQAQLHTQMQARTTASRGAVTVTEANATQRAAQSSSTEPVQLAAPAFGALKTTHPAAGFVPAVSPRPRFRIDDSGQLQRSVQPGIWMPVPIASDAHLRVVSISANDVWAGGDRLRLFHSADDGLTWSEVRLPSTASRTHAIVHIRVDSPQHVTVEDDTGSTWTTTDAGATWQ